MADVNYIITIKGGGGGEQEKKAVSNSPKGDSIEKNKEIKKFAVSSFKYALQYAQLAASTNISRVELRTGNKILQAKQQFNYDVINQGINFATSIAEGALFGGWAGAAAGAVAGIVSAVNTYAIQPAINQQTINLERSLENVSIGLANIRAGAGGGRNN